MRYYFVGIGGISMSGIAKLLIKLGHQVLGSDIGNSEIIQDLKKQGIKIYIGHDKDHINSSIDRLVYSSAVLGGPGKIEVDKAMDLGIKVLKRAEMIGELLENKFSIAISGMHGKTTVTAMVGLIFRKAKLDPTILLGGKLKEIGGNVRIGKSKYIVAEACEYDRSFLEFNPKVAVVTNIGREHLDYFKNLANIIAAFKDFVKTIAPAGLLVACGDSSNVKKILASANCEVITYGFSKNNDIIIKNTKIKNQQIYFSLQSNKLILPKEEIIISIPGIHNVLNATAAIIVTKKLQINNEYILKALEEFKGVRRRFEILGKKNGVLYIDDYAHHPTEIKKTLEAARQFFKKQKLWIVFQPHQYSRTKLLFDQFIKSFDKADVILVPPVYEVVGREEDKSVGSAELVNSLKKLKKRSFYFPNFKLLGEYLQKNTQKGDIVITMGAGPVNKIASDILSKN